MRAVTVRPEEWAVGMLEPESLEELLASVARHGVAVLHRAIPVSVCELLQGPLYADAERMLQGSFWPPQPERGALGHGHVNLGPPRCAPWVHSDIVGNPVVEQTVAAAIGRGAQLGFYNGICNLSGSRPQPLHLDSAWPWQTQEEATAAGQPWPPPTTTLAVYIAVDDIDASNGAEEIWPGSHCDVAAAAADAGEPLTGTAVEMRRRSSPPPTRLVLPKGSVAFVDGRLWRRGVPNFAARARPMVVLKYIAPDLAETTSFGAGSEQLGWGRRGAQGAGREEGYIAAALASIDRRLIFCSDCQDAFARPTQLVDRNARFVHGPVDHQRNVFGPGGAEEGAPTGAEIDSSVPGNEPTSMRSSSLEMMAALPLDGSLGLRPEEDYTYVDQPWNRSFLFGVAYGVPHSASLLSLPPHQLQIPPTAPQSAGSLVRGAAGGAKL